MRSTFMNAIRLAATAGHRVMGETIEFTLKSGQKISVDAIFRPRSQRVDFARDGAEIIVKVPFLSISRHVLIAAGLTDLELEKQMKEASFVHEGRHYEIRDGEDDELQKFTAWPILKKTEETQTYRSPYEPPSQP